jgi:hypothetical protein
MSEKRNWTPEEDNELRRLIAEGASFSLIAPKLNRPRNACIGRAHRLGVKSTNKSGFASGGANPAVERSHHTKVTPFQRAMADQSTFHRPTFREAKIMEEPIPCDLTPANSNEPVSFLVLKNSQCRTVVGSGEDGLSLHCGAPVKRVGTPYCEECRSKFFVPLRKGA